MTDIDKAIEFVRKNGSKFEQARLKHILGEPFEVDEIISGFSEAQNPDGGFPFGDIRGYPSCLSNTAMALHTLADMGLGDSEPARLAAEFLQGRMAEDGTWQENEKIKPLDPPFWDMPGDEDTTLWLTADIADQLMRLGIEVRESTALYLKGRQRENGSFEGYQHTTWIALSLFGDSGLRDKDVFQGALSYLEGANLEEWDVSCITWCLDSMRRGNVPAGSPLWNRLLSQLDTTQEEDGAWPCESGDMVKVRDANSVLAVTFGLPVGH